MTQLNEAKNYDNIEKQEAELAIELAQELLKATYQYATLDGRLKALKSKSLPELFLNSDQGRPLLAHSIKS